MGHDITHYTQRPDVQKFYTVQETADLLDTSCDEVRRIVLHYKVKHETVRTRRSRAIMLDYDAYRLVKLHFEEKVKRREEVRKKTELKAQGAEDKTDSAELHPLVTDKRWLKLNEWPDVLPSCLQETDKND